MTRSSFVSVCYAYSLVLILIHYVMTVNCGMNKPRQQYAGYKLLQVSNVTSEYQDVLIQVLEHRDTVQIWRLPKVGSNVEILVGQSRLEEVMEYLKEIEVETQIIQEDISLLLNEEREKYLAPTGSHLTWGAYHDYEDIVNYFVNKIKENSTKAYLSSEVIGKSEMERDIYLFIVSSEPPQERFQERPKPAIWIDAGLHGRDWLAIASSTFILNRLLSGDYDHILEEYDFYITPLLNPDGYHYTRSTDRFWAKNVAARSSARGCDGVNLDRNFAVMYRGELMHIFSKGTGVAHNPCSDYYGGMHNHIEPEVTSLSRAVYARRDHISLYFSLQSYSQTWLIPKEPASRTNDFDKLTKLAQVGNEALEKKSGVKYYISSWDYSQAEPPGKCIDWMKQIANINYSYGVKVRDDGMSRGYLVPATEIPAVGEEILAAVTAMALTKSADQ